MLGWLIVISIADGEAPAKLDGANTLASWRCSMGGLDWIDRLVQQGLATFESGNGYPTRYRSTTAAVLPVIRDGRPPAHRGFDVLGDDYFMRAGWVGEFTPHPERIAMCAPTDQISIEAWDQS